MSEAKAKLTLDATGATKGAKEFQNAADIIFNADKKAKTQLEKPPKDTGAKKAKADLNGIASELSRVTSVSGGLEMALSKIGGGLKIAGVVTLFAAVGKGIYDATQAALELDMAMGKMERRNIGGTAGRELSALQSDLSTIRQAREENQKSIMGEGTNIFKTAGGEISRAMARTGAAITGNPIDVLSPAEREDRLRSAEEKALERIAQKQREIWAIEKERILGNREAAEIMQIEAAYAERVQSAVADRNTELQKQLNAEREALIVAAKLQQGVALGQRNTLTTVAAMRTSDARGALGMSTQAEQRQALNTGIISAGLAAKDAEAASAAAPKDPELAARSKAAQEEVVRLAAEAAKWERDIARSKGDQLKAVDAEMRISKMRVQGRTLEAQIAERRVQVEKAITDAIRQGNTEYAGRLRTQLELTEKQERFQRAIDNSGRLRPEASRLQEASALRRRKRTLERSQRRFDSTGGLLRVQRGTDGRVISGIDPETMERVTPDGRPTSDRNFLSSLRASKGSDPVSLNLFRPARNDSGVSLMPSIPGGVAEQEMTNRGVAAEVKAQAAAGFAKASSAQTESSGALERIGADIHQMAGILKVWHQ